jgi:hypothetical protein
MARVQNENYERTRIRTRTRIRIRIRIVLARVPSVRDSCMSTSTADP